MKNAKLGDGWIFNGYNLSNVARIEKRNDDGTYSVIYDATEQPTEQTVSALERIPKDEQGNPIYEMAENTDVAWDAIVEQTEGDEAMAQTVADSMLADKKAELKKAENAKSKGGATIAEKIASEKARQAAIDNAKANLDIWEKIAGTAKRRKAEAEAEQKRIAEEQKRIAEEARLAEEKRRVEEEAKRVEEARKAEEERLRAEQRELDENGRPFVVAPNGTTTFGEISEDTGLISAPIKLSEGYQDEDGKGYGLVHIEANHGEQIRKAGFASVEEFVSFVAKNYDKDNIRVGKRRDNARSTTYLIQVTDEHNNTLFVELSRDGSYWNVNSGGIFRKGYSNKKETVVKTEPQQPNNANSTSSSLSVEDKSGTSTTEPNGEPTVSTDKGTTKNETDKEVEEKIAEAEKEVDTNPTENQKLAGNYKKGHVNVEGYDVTIENPKGSVRRGTDKNGRQWEQKMNNTYGYIRGTQSVDGDHIDIFLSDNPTQGDVFVVDQVNEDGSFDEHKVMFGFNSLEEAKAAYLSNYEEGWKGLGTITQVSKEEFRKWIESSHRKTKPFAEYKSLNTKQKSTEDNKVDSKTKYLQAKDIIDEYIKTKGKSNMDDFNVLKKELTDDELNSLWLYLENQKKKSIQAVLFKSIINHELGTRKNAENTKEVEQQANETDKETNDPLAEIEDKETYVEEQNKKGGEVKKKEEKAGNDALEGKEVKTKTKTETKQANKEATKQQTKNETIKEVAVEPTEKIEDVGEKIGGARKDIAVEFKQRAQEALEKSTDDLEEWIRETPISKIFNFDLQKLRESGMSNEVVSFIKICKQAIPAKPKLNRKLVSWAATTMKIYQMCLQAGTNWNEIKSLIDGSYSQASFAIMYQAYMAVGGFDSGLELNGAMLQQLGEVSVGYKNGEPYSLKGQWYISHAGSYGDIYETKEKAIEALMKFAGENAVPKGKKIEFVVYQRRNDGTCFITPKGKPDIIIQDGFKTSIEANDYRKEHGAELEERYRALMTGTTAKFDENRERKGRDYRGGKNVSAQEFMDAFGFRGVEFGNWTNQNDRQNSINEAYDALMDLADVLGVSPKALSLNGTLGMAFGARGQGKANAHYEPDKVVINLTKTRGHGALAHEWFHALDNYFASMVGVKGGYATDKNTLIPTNTWIRNKDGQFTYRDENGRELSGEELIKRFEDYGVRKEMAEAWVNLMDKVRQSDYYERSDKYAQLHGSKYLVEPTELGARAFSKWVENELSKRNATNDYLANNPALFAEELDDVVKKYTPYPFDIDATWMEEAFGALFSTMEQKTDENTGKVMLYHKADGTTEVLSDAETALRDALIGTLEGAGIDVITDNEEAQRVLDMANEGVRLEAKKRALETASVTSKKAHQPTVVSSADGAKILKELDKLYSDFKNLSNQSKFFFGEVAKALGAQRYNSKSEYATFETMNGKIVTIRLADHNATVSNFDNSGKFNGISIVISPKKNSGLNNDGTAHIVEYYYDAIKLRKAEGKPLAEIVRSIKQALYSGEYKDTTGLAERQEVNEDGIRENRLNLFYNPRWSISPVRGEWTKEKIIKRLKEIVGAKIGYSFAARRIAEFDSAEELADHMFYHGTQFGGGRLKPSILMSDREIERIGGGGYGEKYWGISVSKSKRVASNFSSGSSVRIYPVILVKNAKVKEMPELKDAAELDDYIVDLWKEGIDAVWIGDKNAGEQELCVINPAAIVNINNPDIYKNYNLGTSDNPLSIIDDKGINKLYEDSKRYVNALENKPKKPEKPSRFLPAKDGEMIGEMKSNEQYQKELSEYESKLDEYNNSNEVRLFNEEDEYARRNIRFFRTADGKAYGFTVDGKIYIDTTSAKADTPIHEYTHLWASAFRKNNPQEWSNIVELMKGTPEWEEVKKNYPELITDDEIADEVLAHYSGRRGAERLREEQQKVLDGNADVFEKASAVSAIARVKDALKRFWKGVAEWFNIHFTSAEEVADKVLADMLNGLNPNATDNIGTFDPNNADIRYSKDIDTNRGYTQRENGTYISNRALYAEEQGRFTKGTFAKNYGVSTKALEALEKLGVISASEWHHTGKNFNKSNFYSWQDDGTIVDGKYISYENGEALEGSVADKYAKNKKEIDKLAKEFENKEWEYKIPKPHLYSIPFFDNYANEQVPYSAYKLTDEEENRRESEHNLISKRGREDEWYLPRERRYDHLAVDEKYREIENKRKAQWIEEHRAELEQSYNNEYADKIDANNKVDAENATIDEYNQQTNGKEKVLERIAEILGVSPNIKAISTQEQIDIETNRRIEQSRMLDQQVREEMEKRREELKKWVDAQIKKGNITTFERVSKSDIPQNSAITKTEMNGKYGWFDATTRYNLPEYYSGYSFKTKSWLDKYNDKKKSANDFYAIRAELEPQYTNADNTESDEVRYRIREGEAPKKTGIGYKVFVLKDGQLYPPMVANPNGEATPVGVWLDADAAPIAGQSKTGRSQVKSGGKGTQGGSGKLAYRPGWHLGEIPYALQFNRQDENGERTLFPKNFVWAEVEYANDVDYQDEAMSYGYNQNGKFQHSLAGLPRVPENGAYTYRTNPNPETDPWIITGAMKVNRLLTPTEVDEMVRKVGREPQVRQEGAITDEEINALNEQIENVKRSTDETIQEINDRFNEELQQQIDGTLPKGHIYQMGMPSKILLSTGVPNLPIEMSATNLAEHAKKTRHPFELKDVKGLVNALQKPIAIFSYGDKTKSQNIIVEVQKDGRNFLVGIHFNQNRNGIEVSSIRGIFPKENSEWLNWINQNKLLYVNKEKIQTLIDQQRKNLADVEYLDLDSVAKVVQNFENPSIEEEKSSTNPLKMKERVEELAEKLNLGNVEIVTNVSQLNGKEKRAKGFFNKRTGKITIVLPNNANIADIEQTLLHEAVVHYGLRQIFGARFDTFLDNVFNNASEEVRRKIVALAAKNGWDFRTATEEYLASLAETTNFEEAQKEGWWKKVKQFFSDMLEQLGFKGFKGNASTDNELRYILWRSYENLKNGGANNNLFNEASDIAKQYELGVGQYANTGNDVMYRDGDPIQHERQLARARYEERMQNKWYQSKEAFQDSMLSLKEAMQAILGKQVRMEDVAGFENAYLGENRLSSVNKAEADAFAHTLFKPMLDEVAKLAPTQAERQELTKYMMALVLFFHYSFIKSL